MTFGKPFQAAPVKLGAHAVAEEERKHRLAVRRRLASAAALAVLVFIIGMVATNWNLVRPKIATFYPTCASARADGVTPIKRGEPGYLAALDADSDGVACEPHPRRWGATQNVIE